MPTRSRGKIAMSSNLKTKVLKSSNIASQENHNLHSSLAMIDQFVAHGMAVIGLRSSDHGIGVHSKHAGVH